MSESGPHPQLPPSFDGNVVSRCAEPLPYGDLSWHADSTVSPPGPTGLVNGPSLMRCVPSRSAIFGGEPLPDPSKEHMYVQVKDLRVYDYVPRTANLSNVEELFDGSATEFERHGKYRVYKHEKQVRQGRGVVIAKAIDTIGRSVAVVIRNEQVLPDRVPFFITLANEEFLRDKSKVQQLLQTAEERAGVRHGCLWWQVERRAMAYGLRLDPKDIRKRRMYTVLRVTAPTPCVRNVVAKALMRMNVGVEEWTLDPAFSFYDAKSLPPEGWMVIKRGRYALKPITDRISTRHIEVDVSSRDVVGLEFAREETRRGIMRKFPSEKRDPRTGGVIPEREDERDRRMSAWKERAEEHMDKVIFPKAPQETDIAPALVVSFDGEMNSEVKGEMCNPERPGDAVTVLSMAFYWVGRAPSVLKRRDQEQIEQRYAEQRDIVNAYMDTVKAERVAELRTKIEEEHRIDENIQRMREDPKSCLRDFERTATLEAGDEPSDEQRMRALEEEIEGEREKHFKNARKRCEHYPWPTFVPRGPVAGTGQAAAAAAESIERQERSSGRKNVASGVARGGIRPYETFLHVTLVNTSTGPCDPVDGVLVEQHDTEEDLLKAFRNWLVYMEVDGIRGYNINAFDLPYIQKRARMLGVEKHVMRMSHVMDEVLRIRIMGGGGQRKKDGKKQMETTVVKGFGAVDIMDYAKGTLRLDSYKLQRVAEEYNLLGKHDVDYTHIHHAHAGPIPKAGVTDSERNELRVAHAAWKAVVAKYCAQDANLCVEIVDRMMAELGWIEFARVMRTPQEDLWSSGQQVRVVNQLAWFAHRGVGGYKFVLNDLRFRGEPAVAERIKERRRAFLKTPKKARRNRLAAERESNKPLGMPSPTKSLHEDVEESFFEFALRDDPFFAKAMSTAGWRRDTSLKSARPSSHTGTNETGGGNEGEEMEEEEEDGEDEESIQRRRIESKAVQLAHDEGISYQDALSRVEDAEKSYSGGAVLAPTKGMYMDPPDDGTLRAIEVDGVEDLCVLDDGRLRVHYGDGSEHVRDTRYTGQVATLDFMSLYPSIEITYNLCYSTFLPGALRTPDMLEQLKGAGHELFRCDVSGNGTRVHYFVRNMESLLPTLLERLWKLRQFVKAQMKEAVGANEPDWDLWSVLNAKQLAIKVSMNSFYGSTGVKEHKGAKYPCFPVAETTTFMGRTHVYEAKEIAEEYQDELLVHHAPCCVVYGDTDSIMSRTPLPPIRWLRMHRLRAWLLSNGPQLPPDQGGGVSKKERVKLEQERKARAGAVALDIVDRWCATRNQITDANGEGDGDEVVVRPSDDAFPQPTVEIMHAISDVRITREERIIHAWEVNTRLEEVLNESYRRRKLKAVQMEFEELKERFLLQGKKMYANVPHEELAKALTSNKLKLKVSGLAAKKRDRCRAIATTQDRALHALVLERDVEKAWRIIRSTMLRLARGAFPVRDLIIAKRISNKYTTYKKVPEPHVTVAWRQEKIMFGSEPKNKAYVHYWLAATMDVELADPPESVLEYYIAAVEESLHQRKGGSRKRDLRAMMGGRSRTAREQAEETVHKQIGINKRNGRAKENQGLMARAQDQRGALNAVEYVNRAYQPFEVVLKFTGKYGAFKQLYRQALSIASEFNAKARGRGASAGCRVMAATTMERYGIKGGTEDAEQVRKYNEEIEWANQKRAQKRQRKKHLGGSARPETTKPNTLVNMIQRMKEQHDEPCRKKRPT